MHTRFAGLLMCLLLSLSPLAAQAADGSDDLTRYQRVMRVAQDAYFQLSKSHSGRWRVAITLGYCGQDAAAKALMAGDVGNTEIDTAITAALRKGSPESATLTGFETMMVRGLVASLISTYKIGYGEATLIALQREDSSGALCGVASEALSVLKGEGSKPR